jgi:hypothetical protein
MTELMLWFLVVIVVIVLWVFAIRAHSADIKHRGTCPKCGAGNPRLVGEWDGEMYECRHCGTPWDEVTR